VTVIPARRRGQHTWSPQNRLLEPSTPREMPTSRPEPPAGRSTRPDLPVRVIPSQPQASAPWTDADVERGGGDYVLHYDPETAALVNEDVSHLAHDSHTANFDQRSWTETTYSDERNDVPTAPTVQSHVESHTPQPPPDAEHRPSEEH
jgi:hypothetical protein